MLEYRLKLPKINVNFDKTQLSFSINHLRSRRPSIIYFLLHLYNIDDEEIYYDGSEVVVSSDNEVAYTSPRYVVGTAYSDGGMDYVHDFTIGEALLEESVYCRLELVTLGIDSENPLYMAELMFQQSTFNGYHVPNELDKEHSHIIALPNNNYANLYTSDGDYLQVIRPNKESFNTNELSKAQYTILAPHFETEDDIDSHQNVFFEAMNQTEQTIDVLR